MASQQKSHVPKFGNWDSSDNIPYTAYFEKARRDNSKGDEKVIMNPNDPEENPEAFMAMEMTLNRNNNSSSQLPSLPHFNSTTSSNYKSKYSTNEQSSNYYNTQVENRRRRVKISNDSQKSINTSHDQSKANTSTERSSSDYSNNSLQQQSRRSARSDSNNKSSTTYASDDFSAALSMQGHIRHSSGSNSHSIDQQRAASIPKFGAWDETDPRSGENFTIIFNKVKEEKQNIASAQFPTPFNPPHVHNQRSRSSASKICCCLFSNGGD